MQLSIVTLDDLNREDLDFYLDELECYFLTDNLTWTIDNSVQAEIEGR